MLSEKAGKKKNNKNQYFSCSKGVFYFRQEQSLIHFHMSFMKYHESSMILDDDRRINLLNLYLFLLEKVV